MLVSLSDVVAPAVLAGEVVQAAADDLLGAADGREIAADRVDV
jgi:hypothetical protein